jgi:hypothetical protein
MAEPALGIFRGDGIEGRGDLLFDGRERARLSGAQRRLELGPAKLNRRQVWGVARQGQQREAGTFQEGARLREAMGGEVVHDHGGAGLVRAQAGDQDVLQKRLKHRPVGGRGHSHGADQTAQRQRAKHGKAMPVTGCGAVGALPPRGARIKPRQLGADPSLVEKDQGLGCDALDRHSKGGAFGDDVGTRLLTRPERLFLRVKPRRLRVTESTGRLTWIPVCAASRALYSARVA